MERKEEYLRMRREEESRPLPPELDYLEARVRARTGRPARRPARKLVFAAALFMSIGGLCVKMIPWQALSINSFRSLLSVVVLLAFARLSHHRLRLSPGVLLGGLAVFGATTLYTVANKMTTAGNAVLLQFTAPIFVILFSWLVFREKPHRRDIVACLCVFGGVCCFFLDSLGSGRLAGDVVAVIAGVSYCWVFMMNKLPGADPLCSAILGHGLGGLVGLPSLVQESQFTPTALTCGVLLGVVQMGLAYACLTTGIRYVKPVTASLVTGIEPVLNPILVALVVGEVLTPLALVGGAIVFVSVMVYNLRSVQGEQAPAAAGRKETAHAEHPLPGPGDRGL